jgi:phosphatidate cytidylyltransferase
MKRVLTAVVLIPIVLLLVFRAPLWLFAAIVAGLILLTLHEYLTIAEAMGVKPFKWLTYVMSILPFVWLWISWTPAERHYAKFSFGFSLLLQWITVLMAAAVVFGIPLVFRKDLRMGLAASATSLFGVIYIGASLSFLVVLRADQRILVIFVLLSVWAGDIAAYYVGRTFGKHKLVPIVSPNKSWEGAIASVLGSVAVAFLVLHFSPQIDSLFAGPRPLFLPEEWVSLTIPSGHSLSMKAIALHAIPLGIVTNVAAQFGDLFESALKRSAGVKDSGTLLPGHGGMLDRIDALLFAIPVVWYYAHLTGFLARPIF